MTKVSRLLMMFTLTPPEKGGTMGHPATCEQMAERSAEKGVIPALSSFHVQTILTQGTLFSTQKAARQNKTKLDMVVEQSDDGTTGGWFSSESDAETSTFDSPLHSTNFTP